MMKKKLIGIVLAAATLAASCTAFADTEWVQMRNFGVNIDTENTPFEDNGQLYVPLRDTLNGCGVSNIDYDNGTVNFTIASSDYETEVSVTEGQQNIKFSLDYDNDFWEAHGGARTTSHPALLKDGVMYVPLGMLIHIKNFDVEISDEIHRLNLLPGLEIIRYNTDDTVDVMISKTEQATSKNVSDYLYEKENAVIGTAEQLDAQPALNTEVNFYYFPSAPEKRILVDENNEVIAVCPIDCQYHEALVSTGRTYYGGTYSWQGIERRDPDKKVQMRNSFGKNIFENATRSNGNRYCRLMFHLDINHIVTK